MTDRITVRTRTKTRTRTWTRIRARARARTEAKMAHAHLRSEWRGRDASLEASASGEAKQALWPEMSPSEEGDGRGEWEREGGKEEEGKRPDTHQDLRFDGCRAVVR